MPQIKAVCISKNKGQKSKVKTIKLIEGLGVCGDFHAKGGERQVSLLAEESVQKMREKEGGNSNSRLLFPGAFGENIITEGIDLLSLSIGQKISIVGEDSNPRIQPLSLTNKKKFLLRLKNLLMKKSAIWF